MRASKDSSELRAERNGGAAGCGASPPASAHTLACECPHAGDSQGCRGRGRFGAADSQGRGVSAPRAERRGEWSRHLPSFLSPWQMPKTYSRNLRVGGTGLSSSPFGAPLGASLCLPPEPRTPETCGRQGPGYRWTPSAAVDRDLATAGRQR